MARVQSNRAPPCCASFPRMAHGQLERASAISTHRHPDSSSVTSLSVFIQLSSARALLQLEKKKEAGNPLFGCFLISRNPAPLFPHQRLDLSLTPPRSLTPALPYLDSTRHKRHPSLFFQLRSYVFTLSSLRPSPHHQHQHTFYTRWTTLSATRLPLSPPAPPAPEVLQSHPRLSRSDGTSP